MGKGQNEIIKDQFYAQPVWSESDESWMCESNIIGLHVFTFTLEECYKMADFYGKDLIKQNHYRDTDMTDEDMYSRCDFEVRPHKERE